MNQNSSGMWSGVGGSTGFGGSSGNWINYTRPKPPPQPLWTGVGTRNGIPLIHTGLWKNPLQRRQAELNKSISYEDIIDGLNGREFSTLSESGLGGRGANAVAQTMAARARNAKPGKRHPYDIPGTYYLSGGSPVAVTSKAFIPYANNQLYMDTHWPGRTAPTKEYYNAIRALESVLGTGKATPQQMYDSWTKVRRVAPEVIPQSGDWMTALSTVLGPLVMPALGAVFPGVSGALSGGGLFSKLANLYGLGSNVYSAVKGNPSGYAGLGTSLFNYMG